MEGPGVLVPTLPQCLFFWPGRGSVHESRLLKITRLSIIPSATLRDSVFQGPSCSLGTGEKGQEGLWMFLARRACTAAAASQP